MSDKIPNINVNLTQVKSQRANTQVPLSVTAFIKTETGPIGEFTKISSYNEAVSTFGLGTSSTPALFGIEQVLRSYGHINIVRIASDSAEKGIITINLNDSDDVPYTPSIEVLSGETTYKTGSYNGDEVKLVYDAARTRLSIRADLNGTIFSTPLEIIDLTTAKASEVEKLLDKLVDVWNSLNTGITLKNEFINKLEDDKSILPTDIAVGTVQLGDSGNSVSPEDAEIIKLFELLEDPRIEKQDIVIVPEFRSHKIVNEAISIRNKYFFITCCEGNNIDTKSSNISLYDRSDEAVCYIPSKCKMYDSEIEVPFECAVLYAWANSFSDSRYKAPAGTNRATLPLVTDIVDNLADTGAEVLYNNEIPANPVKYISGYGFTLYGQKTMDPTKEFTNRINISGLTNYIKEESQRILNPYVFEYTPVGTFQKVYIDLSKLFDSLVNQDVIYNDYQIVCDESNNTQETLSKHELHVSVAIKPLSVTEYIYLDLTVTDQLGGI